MTGAEIISEVLLESRLSREAFFGSTRLSYVVGIRRIAIQRMMDADFKQAAIARSMRRCHTTISYWQRGDFRDHRRTYYATRHAADGRPARTFKTTEDQRLEMLALFRDGRADEMMAMQSSLGVCSAYTYRLAMKRAAAERRKLGLAPLKSNKVRELIADRTPHPSRFTKDEESVGRTLLARNAPSSEFVRVMGRTRKSVRARLRLIEDADYREKTMQASAKRDRERRAAPRSPAIPRASAPADRISDAMRRAAAPRTLTALAFGDPPPGYSALDRRGEAQA